MTPSLRRSSAGGMAVKLLSRERRKGDDHYLERIRFLFADRAAALLATQSIVGNGYYQAHGWPSLRRAWWRGCLFCWRVRPQ